MTKLTTEMLLKRREEINEQLRRRDNLPADIFLSLHRDSCSLKFIETEEWRVSEIYPDLEGGCALIIPRQIIECLTHNVRSMLCDGYERQAILTEEILNRFDERSKKIPRG